ncbi:MAG TPA: orotate phosphoribosyltransferase [Candidatus Nanoarchaeia archaeon]|nr:orotate phosphoribosyltransferase [Candidatus Nanoarchaeia archaeon]
MSEETKHIEMAKILTNIDAVEFGLFKLSSGKATPYYVDLRIVPSFPDAYKDICELYVQTIIKHIGAKNFDRITGIPIAGIPFASLVAYLLKKPFLYVRKGAKLHGRERRVEGILVSGDRVLLIDDLVTTGLTLKEAADSVRAEGGVVTDAVAFLDREEGGKELLEKSGVKLHSLLKMSEMAKILYDMGAIDDESLKTINKQIKKK